MHRQAVSSRCSKAPGTSPIIKAGLPSGPRRARAGRSVAVGPLCGTLLPNRRCPVRADMLTGAARSGRLFRQLTSFSGLGAPRGTCGGEVVWRQRQWRPLHNGDAAPPHSPAPTWAPNREVRCSSSGLRRTAPCSDDRRCRPTDQLLLTLPVVLVYNPRSNLSPCAPSLFAAMRCRWCWSCYSCRMC